MGQCWSHRRMVCPEPFTADAGAGAAGAGVAELTTAARGVTLAHVGIGRQPCRLGIPSMTSVTKAEE